MKRGIFTGPCDIGIVEADVIPSLRIPALRPIEDDNNDPESHGADENRQAACDLNVTVWVTRALSVTATPTSSQQLIPTAIRTDPHEPILSCQLI